MLDYFIFDYVNLTHGYIYLTANYFMAAGIPLLLGDFNRKPRWKCALILAAEIIICILLLELYASIYYAIFRDDTYVPFTGGLLLLVLYALVRCKQKPVVRIMYASAYFGLSCLALNTTMSIGSLLGVPYYYLQWWLISANALMIFSAVFFVRYFSAGSEMIRPPVIVVAVAVASALCFLYAFVRLEFRIDPATSLALCFIFIFSFLIMYFSMSYILRKSYMNTRKLANQLMVNSDEDVLRLSRENLESLHEMRHELKNQYAIMKTFLDGGDYDKLRRYFSEYSDMLERTVSFADYGNGTLNAILSVEQGRARSAGVELECKIGVPEKLQINEVDMCSLLMNLVDNAVEYYERNEGATERRIALEVLQINQTLFVKVSNPILPEHCERALTLRTSKKDKNLHGYGSKVVAYIVEKYNGSLHYETAENVFTVSAMLCCGPAEGAAETKAEE